MNKLIFLGLLFGLSGLLGSRSVDQNGHPLGGYTRVDSSSSIRIGDSLDGVKYYIKIVPHDTTLDEKMPMYEPSDSPEFVVLDQQLTPIKRVQPTYPENARRSKIEGTVWILCLVGKDGKVQKTKVHRTDSELLVEPAINAAKQWLFSPGKLKGAPVAVLAAIPFRFKLDR
jgi:TonB family protein